MYCKKCGEKVSVSKPLLVIAIIEGVLIICLFVMLYIVGGALVAKEGANTTDPAEEAARTIANNTNLSQYYTQCDWCPNYGFITGAELKNFNAGGNEAKYTYSLSDSELAKYTGELEKMLFIKNPFSTGTMILYAREVGDVSQEVTLMPSRENNEITVFAYEKTK